jgi:adenosylcobyric acid synthase
VALQRKGTGDRGPGTGEERVRIGVIRLPRISNYTDFDTLEREFDVELSYVELAEQLEGLDLVIIPGSKSTLADLAFLRRGGFFPALRSFGGTVLGICGGFQMLGRRVSDPEGVEGSEEREAEGVGLLDVVTLMRPDKETHQVEAVLLSAAYQLAPKGPWQVKGYEIHMGETILGGRVKPFSRIVRRSGEEVEVLDGAVSHDGRIGGTYLHGIFDDDTFRTAFLNRLRRGKGMPEQEEASGRPDPFELLADHLEKHLDMKRLFALCGLPDKPSNS